MPRFSFTIGGPQGVRHAGIVHGARFQDAVSAIDDRVEANHGDVLEIGVAGFPPARYTRVVTSFNGDESWAPVHSRAA